ncbi:MAG: GNAT family N-acetyltransferase [Nitriliruptoraceae bacterium]|nr:GNAT family N-acetyltransferase [Nitriliruptoraceae bacterium]
MTPTTVASPAPSSATREVRVLTADHLEAAIDVLARGFAEEPGNVALIPDAEDRVAMLRIASRLEIGRVMPLGTVHVALVDGTLGGVAVWHPPATGAGSLSGFGRALARSIPAVPGVLRPLPHKGAVLLGHAHRAMPLARSRRRASARASAGTSWHLAFLATAPEFRGRGLARHLLDRQLDRCDQDGTPAWLETTDPVNPPLYESFGFTIVTHVEDAAWLPGLWVMRREPTVGLDGSGS